ncbi:MAG: FecR domain-containing protein [Methylomonas sp.]|jgi:hypothetical protein
MKLIQFRFVIILLCSVIFSLQCRNVLAEDWRYRVQEGDNLWSLTEKYLLNMSYVGRLGELNKIADPLHIPPGTVLRIPVAWINRYAIPTAVKNIHGQAELTKSESGETAPLASGDLIYIGDTVITRSDSSLLLEFTDGSTLLVQPDSRLTLDNLILFGESGMMDTRIRLNEGRVETRVEKTKGPASRFEISTPVGVTSVRGTNYRVSSESDTNQSHAEVLEGGVRVNSAGRGKLITGGYGSVLSLHQAPSAAVELLGAVDTQSIPEEFGRVPIQLVLPADRNISGYRLQIARDSSFDDVLFDRKYETNQIRGPELPDGDYAGRIRGIDKQGLEGKNAEIAIKINAKPEAPFLQEPKPDVGLSEETPGFIWARQDNVQKYHFQLARDNKFTDLVADFPDLTDNAVNSGYALELKQYFWRVASIGDAEGQGPFSDPQTFKRVQPPPQAEEPSINDTSLILRWPADLPDAKYRFQMAKDESFAEPLIDKVISEPTLEIERPEAGEYYIRVCTQYADGFVGPFGKPQIIEISDDDYWWLLGFLPLLALIAI